MSDRVPRFSITIPAYNAAETLAETIASVQAQTLGDWEVVVVDDGSSDATSAITTEFMRQDQRIRLVSQENRGSGGAYNTAVRNARADLIVMLSADDLLTPEHLANISAAEELRPEASIFTVGGWYEYEDGTRDSESLHLRWEKPDGCSLGELLSACFFGTGAVYRRQVHETVGGFREDIYAEDYLFWLMAMAHGFKHHYVNHPLAVHRRNSEQKSADAIKMRRADVDAIRVVVGSGLLTDTQMRAATHSLRRLRANLVIRSLLARGFGEDRSQRLIDWLRGLSSGHQT
ncbi:MAG: glycosyltransferase family 2 protein [Coriobacteriia bacterium]|nr:glycosyltransferase family 2 protein [Coriobacteriia bacterium]